MLRASLLDPVSVLVLAIVSMMITASVRWLWSGHRQLGRLAGGLVVLRRIGLELHAEHPIRRRLELAPVVELSFEEIARLMHGRGVDVAARGLLRLRERTAWIERFAQFSVHLGILGTVLALIGSDPTALETFRAALPQALGTTFFGLVGALVLSLLAGACETVLERAELEVRRALLEGLDHEAASAEAS